MAANPLSIQSIRIERLFGFFTYTVPAEESQDLSRLLILYGDNGSGKTTILKLIFWLLSSKDKSGYKTEVAKTRFKHFSIQFKNGMEIGADRSKGEIGSFTYFINDKGKSVHSITCNATPENSISFVEGSPENAKFLAMLEFIKSLNISVYYLSDDRKMMDSMNSTVNENDSDPVIWFDSSTIAAREYEAYARERLAHENKLSVEKAIERLLDWVRTKTIYGSKLGEKTHRQSLPI